MPKTEITITGMTCGHCEMSVTNEIATLEGVEGVKVDHASGTAVVASTGVTDEQFTEAVEEAGYQAVGFAKIDA
ncbi:MAG: cation transporter [Aquiluna sp.]|jgi:copper chaperone|tara:strand:- start:307 stop:528 length:222 start_codon:yes stop_codon:yes gene_type:complete